MIRIPEPALEVLGILNKNGFEGYLVGGCVRDSLLGHVPKDFDITTDALPEEISRCFAGFRVVETGVKHGTLTVIINHMPIEITTFRIDGEYTDNRRPETVTFSSNIKDDLSRRDFTVNAMAYHPVHELTDFFGGKEDLRNGIIRCVGEPDKRFGEDALRILRALRFASVLGFDIDQATSESILKNAALLKNISSERICAEFNKLITGRDAVDILDRYREVIAVFIPEIRPMFGLDQRNKHHLYDVWQHTLKAIAASPPDMVLRLSMLFHDIGKPLCFTVDDKGVGHFYGHPKVSARICGEVMARLRYDNDTRQSVKTLVTLHDTTVEANSASVRRMLNRIGEEPFRRLLDVKRADTMAQNPAYTDERLEDIARIEAVLDTVMSEKQCFSIKDLAVNGHDLMSLGISGRRIGEILDLLLGKVMDGEAENDKAKLLELAGESKQ